MSAQRTISRYINSSWRQGGFPEGFHLAEFLCRLKISSRVPESDRYRLHALREIGGIYLAIALLAAFGSESDEESKAHRQVALSQGAQVASHIVAVLRLVSVGMDVQARIIARSCAESADLLLLCIINIQTAREFVGCESAEDANLFWHKNCAKGRAEKAIQAFFVIDFQLIRPLGRSFKTGGRTSRARWDGPLTPLTCPEQPP